ncbi:ABC transporter permease subunit [Alicyclobacillus shizuokensis]|uniref:ABC transporter permease subunit n=1 Tax=Alicyclobacillus shizuokensis TaxID=392014 RepID=UPI00082E4517|nr:ABC transporter permease subunit [Alicyclobacillus shizuokensis]
MRSLSIVRFEAYKLFSRASLWVFLAVMVAGVYLPLQVFTVAAHHPMDDYQNTPVTAQQVAQAKREANRLRKQIQEVQPGTTAYDHISYEIERDQAIIDSASGSVEKPVFQMLQHTIHKLQREGNTGFAYRMYNLEYNMYRNLPFIGGGGNVTSGGSMAADFVKTYGFVIYGAMILVGLSPVFSKEYADGTAGLLLPARRGREALVTAKVLASILYITVMQGILFSVNVLSNLLLFGTQGLDYPLQSIPLYGAPFHLSVWHYLLVSTGIQWFAGMAFGLLVLWLSSLFSSSLTTFFLAAGILALPELLRQFTQAIWVDKVFSFSYTGLLQVSGLFVKFEAYDVFGYPVLYPVLVLLLAAVICVPIVLLTYRSFCRHQPA